MMITEKQIENLNQLLADTGVEHMPVDALQGFLVAISIGPHLVPPSLWLPQVFASGESTSIPQWQGDVNPDFLIKALMDFYNATLSEIQDDSLTPIVTTRQVDGEEEEDFSPWCAGFMHGTQFWGDQWGSEEEEADLFLLLLPIIYLADPEKFAEENEKELVTSLEHDVEELKSEVASLVSVIYGFWFERRTPEPLRVTHVGRNDPCPCGSGKKYKKCCGAP
jgi:uncharacterized protein